MNELLRRLLFLPEQASNFAQAIDELHYFVIIVTMLSSAAVGFGALYFFARYRRKAFNQKTPFVEAPWPLEAGFTIIPLIFFLLWFGMGYRDYIWMTTPPKDAMDIYVMGKQWMWKFNYAQGPNAIGTLHVPANRPVRLLMTSRDVLHSFFVPAFRIKQDVLPGRYTQVWFTATKPGKYPIFCTEYCGLSHSSMWGEVIVMEGAEYDRWYADQVRGLASRQDTGMDPEAQSPESTLVTQGRQLAVEQGCLKCHSVDGEQHIGPTWLDLYGREQKLGNGQTVQADEAYITSSMMDPLAQMVAGYQPVMPTYRGRLSPPETAAIVEYIKSLRSDRVDTQSPQGPSYELRRAQ